MTQLVLRRFGPTPYGTFGELTVFGEVFYTVERRWLRNERHISCIPHGRYKLHWLPTTTHVPAAYGRHTWYVEGDTVGLDGSRDRSRIALHIGNVQSDVSGCIAIGKDLGWLQDQWGVVRSTEALTDLLYLIGHSEAHTLSVMGTLSG